MYLIPKIHNRLGNVADRPVISNFGTPAEKASEFLDHHRQPILKSGVSYIKWSNDFLFKLKNLGKIPENAFLVTSDVVGLYPSIPYDEGLEVSRKQCNALNLLSRTIILNLIQLLNIKFPERLLELNLLHRMHVSLRITLKENFSKANKFSPGFGLDILMKCFSAGQLVKKSLTSF